MEKIAVVITTFNRTELLLLTMTSVLELPTDISSIYVADNNQNEETLERVQKQFKMKMKKEESNESYRRRDYQLYCNKKEISLVYLLMKNNTGGAGGFHHGLKTAFDDNHDWYFLMDDDVAVNPDALNELIKYSNISKCLLSNRLSMKGSELTRPGYFDFTTGRTFFLDGWREIKKDYTFSNLGCFEGMLIHKDIIAKISFPDPDFFMIGDDIIYGYLASYFTNVIFVRSSHVKKLNDSSELEIVRRSYFSKSVNKTYYAIRNQWLIFAYLEKMNLLNKKLAFGIFIYKLIDTVLISLSHFKIKHLTVIVKAMIDGVGIYKKKLKRLSQNYLLV